MSETTTTPDNIEFVTKNKSMEWKSENINDLAKALAKAQAEIKGAKSESKNPFYNSNYADLHTVIESCMPILAKNDLSVVQGHEYCTESNGFYVTTMLMHSSGQWIKSKVRLPLPKGANAQHIGGVTTYGRRYGLSAIVGIAQYDDDGNSLVNKTNP